MFLLLSYISIAKFAWPLIGILKPVKSRRFENPTLFASVFFIPFDLKDLLPAVFVFFLFRFLRRRSRSRGHHALWNRSDHDATTTTQVPPLRPVVPAGSPQRFSSALP